MLVYLLAYVCVSATSCQVYAPESWDGPAALQHCQERARELSAVSADIHFVCEADEEQG